MNKTQLDELKSKLPRNWATIIAQEIGVTPGTVWNAMKCKTHRTDIIECAIKLARETTIATQNNLAEVLNELN